MYIRAASTATIDLPEKKDSGVLSWRNNKDYCFYDNGKDALKAFLKRYKSGSKVAIQFYTCHTVLDVIKELGCIPVFMDICSDYFSSPLSEVKRVVEKEKVDIIIITHLFGVPNPERLIIGDYANDRKLPIIDDLCQTVGAQIDGQYLENIVDNFFYSFYIDKPVGYFNGGLLATNLFTLPNRFTRVNANGEKTLQLLKKVVSYTQSKDYRPGFNPFSRMTHMIIACDKVLSQALIEAILFSPVIIFFTRVFDKIFGHSRIFTIDELICKSIVSSLSNYDSKSRYKVLLRASEKYNLFLPYKGIDNITCSIGSRAAVLVDDPNQTINRMRKDGYEVGLFNWKYSSVPKELHNTRELLNHIINIPTWNDSFYRV